MLPAFLLVALSLAGLPYYLLGVTERVRHPWHAWLRPSGTIGQGLGIAALVMFLFLWLYPLRKRYRSWAVTGSVPAWLDWHIAAGLIAPLAGAVHASWRFSGLIGLGYGAMVVVAASGVVGRYLYSRIPRRQDGLALTLDDVAQERGRLLDQISRRSGLDAPALQDLLAVETPAAARGGIVSTLRRLVADDFSRRAAARRLARALRADAGADRAAIRRTVRLARREMALGQQLRMLEATARLFRLWHAAHKPVAVTALVAVLIHVGVVVAVGATWFW